MNGCLPQLRPIQCKRCDLGLAFDHGRGGFCPLTHRDVEKGELLYEECDTPRYLWMIEQGAVELGALGETLGIRTPGMFVGSEAVSLGRYLSSARALASTRLCAIPLGEWATRGLKPPSRDFLWIAPALRVQLGSGEGG